jgi:hypothetical protein
LENNQNFIFYHDEAFVQELKNAPGLTSSGTVSLLGLEDLPKVSAYFSRILDYVEKKLSLLGLRWSKKDGKWEVGPSFLREKTLQAFQSIFLSLRIFVKSTFLYLSPNLLERYLVPIREVHTSFLQVYIPSVATTVQNFTAQQAQPVQELKAWSALESQVLLHLAQLSRLVQKMDQSGILFDRWKNISDVTNFESFRALLIKFSFYFTMQHILTYFQYYLRSLLGFVQLYQLHVKEPTLFVPTSGRGKEPAVKESSDSIKRSQIQEKVQQELRKLTRWSQWLTSLAPIFPHLKDVTDSFIHRSKRMGERKFCPYYQISNGIEIFQQTPNVERSLQDIPLIMEYIAVRYQIEEKGTFQNEFFQQDLKNIKELRFIYYDLIP